MTITDQENYSPYGKYAISKNLELIMPKTQILIEKKTNKFSYYRKNSEGQELRKSIPVKKDNLQLELAPVLPLNLPSKKTNDLMFLRLKESLIIEKNSAVSILLEFPIEIGVFVLNDDNTKDFFDCFTCEPMHSRFALYGTPENGNLCMYGKVAQLEESEKPKPYVFAKIKATISNELSEGVTIGKLVFPVGHHEMYYLPKTFEAHMDDIDAIIKKEPAGKTIEIHHVELTKKEKNWNLALRLKAKSMKEVFNMNRGFD